MPLWSAEKTQAAWRFAAKAHQGQTVPGSDLPYLVHVGSVTMETMTCLTHTAMDHPDLAVQCALLHDTVEDTDTTLVDIEALFGPDVRAGVAALSKNSDLPKPEAMQDSLSRIREQPKEVWIVKLADRVTNLQPPPSYWTREKCGRYRREGELILSQLGAASPYLAQRLRECLARYGAYC